MNDVMQADTESISDTLERHDRRLADVAGAIQSQVSQIDCVAEAAIATEVSVVCLQALLNDITQGQEALRSELSVLRGCADRQEERIRMLTQALEGLQAQVEQLIPSSHPEGDVAPQKVL